MTGTALAVRSAAASATGARLGRRERRIVHLLHDRGACPMAGPEPTTLPTPSADITPSAPFGDFARITIADLGASGPQRFLVPRRVPREDVLGRAGEAVVRAHVDPEDVLDPGEPPAVIVRPV